MKRTYNHQGRSIYIYIEQNVSKNVDTDTTWDGIIILEKPVYVYNNATLTIKENTLIKCKEDTALIICKDGKLIAEGKRDRCIEFVPYQNDTIWQGIKLLGFTGETKFEFFEELVTPTVINNSIIYQASPENFEQVISKNKDAFRKGGDGISNYNVLKYIKVVQAGENLRDTNAITGYQASGEMENIFVVDAGDDGIEFFAGDINLTNAVIIGSGDDNLDTDNNYTGLITTVFAFSNGDELSTSSGKYDLELEGGNFGNYIDFIYKTFNPKGITPAESVNYRESFVKLNNTLSMYRS